ncbi:MAG: translation initiation factor IF-2 [Candidatus Dadabacteria bacterium]|nr:MAG: translation initiation factor IF-2 [Candidatus Dadabacteria bacterium]
MRVFELARELNVSNQEIIAKLREFGYDVTNHMSSIDDGQARKVRQAFAPDETAGKEVQEKRIRKTVIRRRKVAKPETPVEEAAPAADDASSAEKEAAESAVETSEAPADADQEVAEASETASAAAPEEAAPVAEQEAPESDEASPKRPRRAGARVVDRIAPPPVTPPRGEKQPGQPGGGPDTGGPGKRPRRRVVAKRMYRPSKAEEKTLAKIRQSRQKKRGEVGETQPLKAEKRKIRVEETISVGDLAKAMGVKAGDIIKKFIEMGMMVTINQTVDPETAGVIASEYGYEVEQVGFQESDFLEQATEESAETGEPRPPVVTVMGHVDHGKTSILDAIRKTRVAAGEAGGITQHIGAYQVETSRGKITFLDTPGHAAFTAMRARGAQATDLVVLVVAADDGVMPQTIEAIQHAKAAGVPVVVAVNKIDKPEAQPERIRQQLTEYELIPEEWGGDTMFVDVSALNGQGIDDLLEAIALQAEVLDLKAPSEGKAQGVVVESRVDKGRGAVATVIVQRGTLSVGDIIVAGTSFGRVRALISDTGEKLKTAGPSTPVEILGLNEVPPAGETFHVVENEKIARQIAENRERKERERELALQSKVSLENIFDKIQEGDVKELQVVLKADVQGSMEAVSQAIQELSDSDSDVRVKIVSSGVGAITENDVNLAAASGAVILGFNTRPDSKASRLAQELGVSIEVYGVIYELIDSIRAALQGMLAPEEKEESRGWAKVLETFPIKGVGTVAGSRVESGVFRKGLRVRLVRDGQVLYDGAIANLKRFQEDVDEVQAGLECGILLENFNKVRVGDELECYEVIQTERTLGE